MHSPKILFLDEPTLGLDAVSKLAVRDFIRHLNEETKVTILLTTHDMDDIEALSKRVLLLNQGKIAYDGPLAKLRSKIAPERRLVVDLVRENQEIKVPHVTCIKQEGHRVWLKFNPKEVKAPELIALITSQYEIADLFVENPPIEETIARLYQNESLLRDL